MRQDHRVQLGLLRSLDCDYGQGFLLEQPLDAAEAHTLLTGWSPTETALLST